METEYYSAYIQFLSIAECVRLRDHLNTRIDHFNQLSFPKKPLEELGLSPRTLNALKKAKLNTIEDIVNFGVENLVIIQGIWTKSIKEIQGLIDLANSRINNKK